MWIGKAYNGLLETNTPSDFVPQVRAGTYRINSAAVPVYHTALAVRYTCTAHGGYQFGRVNTLAGFRGATVGGREVRLLWIERTSVAAVIDLGTVGAPEREVRCTRRGMGSDRRRTTT